MSAFDSAAHAAEPIGLTARRIAPARVVDAGLSAALERAREGDETSFSRVFRAVQPGLLRYLTALVGAEAEDVASEAWSQVCRDLSSFRGDIDGFRGWVATIARHRAIDSARARSRRRVELVPIEELPEEPTQDSTEELALESLSTAAAMAAIAALPKEQAEAVLLRAVMGLDAKTAGRVLGKRAGAVRGAAYRGLNALAERLDGDSRSHGHALHNTFGVCSADELR